MIAAISAIEDDEQRNIVEQWYRTYYGLLYREAFEVVRDHEMTKDMINEAFIKIIHNFDKVSVLNHARRTTYLVDTIKSVSFDYIRRKNKIPPMVEEDFESVLDKNLVKEDKGKSPEQILVNNENIEKVAKAMEKLNARDSMLIMEKYYFGKSDEEIGQLMEMKSQYVHVYVKRACEKLLNIVNGDDIDGK
jgi:RNA polymerase sigma-70 factor (ECF subfamily)